MLPLEVVSKADVHFSVFQDRFETGALHMFLNMFDKVLKFQKGRKWFKTTNTQISGNIEKSFKIQQGFSDFLCYSSFECFYTTPISFLTRI